MCWGVEVGDFIPCKCYAAAMMVPKEITPKENGNVSSKTNKYNLFLAFLIDVLRGSVRWLSWSRCLLEDNQGSIPRSHVTERMNPLPQVIFWPLRMYSCMRMHTHMRTDTPTHKKQKWNLINMFEKTFDQNGNCWRPAWFGRKVMNWTVLCVCSEGGWTRSGVET